MYVKEIFFFFKCRKAAVFPLGIRFSIMIFFFFFKLKQRNKKDRQWTENWNTLAVFCVCENDFLNESFHKW